MSAIGSVIVINIILPILLDYYQLAFLTPGIIPSPAFFLKQILHIPNLLKKPRGRPHRGQRLYFRVENLGFLFAFAINDFFAKFFLLIIF